MEATKNKKVLISGASIAGLTTAYLMNQLGYQVTIVEIASELRVNGTPVNIEGEALALAKRMGIVEQIKANRLKLERIEYKNADDSTENAIQLDTESSEQADENIEIERETFLRILYTALTGDVEIIFDNRITSLIESQEAIKATFKTGSEHSFDLVLGCDGSHSGVRKLWFGDEKHYTHFLGLYFSITIVPQLLVQQGTLQLYNVPDKAIMLNAYQGKTDVTFCFFSEKEISYDYRDTDQQRKCIVDQFKGEGWRTPELLEAMQRSEGFYFDKLCQIKMPSWTKGRVALIGDAAYCASPAAGKGGTLAMMGGGALADALEKHNGDYQIAFDAYNQGLRSFVEEVQAEAKENVTKYLVPRTHEGIRERNEGRFFE
ncbi:FAD-dependent monooxygenase [Siphonobacter sp.]|uniref:FAD-dependent monooxygenase n=1 Tax=Siphonobacter sp. TaxID=1869184 RepID=UPI003B3AF016